MSKIKIDFEKVQDQGDKYKSSSEQLNTLQNNLKSIEDEIKAAWNNDENVDFIARFEDDINYLSDFSNFLDGKGELLKKVSGFHEDSEKEFINQMERSEMNNGKEHRY